MEIKVGDRFRYNVSNGEVVKGEMVAIQQDNFTWKILQRSDGMFKHTIGETRTWSNYFKSTLILDESSRVKRILNEYED
jgi:hypothetical protein